MAIVRAPAWVGMERGRGRRIRLRFRTKGRLMICNPWQMCENSQVGGCGCGS